MNRKLEIVQNIDEETLDHIKSIKIIYEGMESILNGYESVKARNKENNIKADFTILMAKKKLSESLDLVLKTLIYLGDKR